MARIIAHFDLDAFFVSVECLLNPSLKGLPLIVGGNSDRGVVAACSYEARRFGVHSAMAMKKARQLCPHATIIPGTRHEYSKYSRLVTEIIRSRAPVVEKASIDEFYLDLTGMDKFHKPFQWTLDLRELIIKETGLPISFGLASNKLVAKIATGESKPNGYLHIPTGKEKDFLDPLAVDKIPGVGEQSRKILHDLNIFTIGDISRQPVALLEHHLGKWGAELYRKSFGKHDSEVVPYQESKSVSSENTFDADISDLPFLMDELTRMTEKIAFTLRQDHKTAGCVTVKIKYFNFETSTRQKSITFTNYDDELISHARELFNQLYRKGTPVRLLGVRFSELTSEAVQGSLFENFDKKAELYKAIDEVKNRFGKNSLGKAKRKST